MVYGSMNPSTTKIVIVAPPAQSANEKAHQEGDEYLYVGSHVSLQVDITRLVPFCFSRHCLDLFGGR